MESIEQYQIIQSPEGCGISFYTEITPPFGDENNDEMELSFLFKDGDIHFYSSKGVEFIFKDGAKERLIQSLADNAPITLIGIDKNSGMLVLDVDGLFNVKH